MAHWYKPPDRDTCIYLRWANGRWRCFSFFGSYDPFITYLSYLIMLKSQQKRQRGKVTKKEKEKWDSVLVSKRSQSVGATVRIKISFSKTPIKDFFFSKAWNYDTNI